MKFAKPLIFSLLFILSSSCYLSAQYSLPVKDEIGLYCGDAFYLGSINPNGFFKFPRIAGGVMYRHNINNRFSYRANLFIGSVTAYDSKSSSLYQQQRNLNFQSPIDELSGEFEFNFLEFETNSPKYNFSTFIFGGLGMFRMDPQARVGNQWVQLQQLGTEGQGTPGNPSSFYHLIQPCIPFGIGVKIGIAQIVCVTLECGLRKTFTGYIDDVNGVYPNPAELLAARGPNGPLAVELSNRSIGTDKAAMVGTERGNGKDEWYSFSGIIISFQPKRVYNACFSYE